MPLIYWRLWEAGIKPWPYYSFLPEGGAIVPLQQANVIRDLAPSLLEAHGIHNPAIQVEVRSLSPEEMIQILQDPNRVVIFTYNTVRGDPLSGHAVVLAAYNPQTGKFGFLNSGAERQEILGPNGERIPTLTWKHIQEIEGYLREGWSAGAIKPHFVIITRVGGEKEGDVIPHI